MQQGALPFQYAEEKNPTGMTALAGLACWSVAYARRTRVTPIRSRHP